MLKPRYDTVIFDLDGTLLDTLDDLTNAVNHAMRENGYPEHTLREVRSYVGNGVGLLIRRSMPRGPEADEEAYQEALQAFKRYYAAHNRDVTAPYPGVNEMLDALSRAGVRTAIVSNKNDPNVKALNDAYFSRWVEVAVGEREGVRRKPYPDTVRVVMDSFACDPRKTLYVGDSEVDLETAKNAEIDCAAVTWGFRTEEQLRAAGATVLVKTPQELTNLVLGRA